MFACGRLVDQATVDNDLPIPGAVLAESIQLCRKDAQNVTRFVTNAKKKLENQLVMVRLKGVRFLLHLVQNGPPSVANELKLYSQTISACMSWRGLPHGTKGYEPYQELKDAAQSLLDFIFSSPTNNGPVTNFSVTNAPTNAGNSSRVAGISNMEAYGSGPGINQSVSLEPRKLDQPQGSDVMGFFKKTFGMDKKESTQSKYGSSSNDGTYTPGYFEQTNPPPAPSPVPAPAPIQPIVSTPFAPPSRGQFDNLQRDVDWSNKKVYDAPAPKPKKVETPVAKLLKVTGNRALPTNGEINAFRAAISTDSIIELIAALRDSDWKIKVRAISGLEVAGEQFGFGAVSQCKSEIEPLSKAPQASLKTIAARFFEKIKDVQPTGIPEEPSAFDFASAQDEPQEGENEVIVFAEEPVNTEAKEEEEKPEQME